jgi:hypothetical protein
MIALEEANWAEIGKSAAAGIATLIAIAHWPSALSNDPNRPRTSGRLKNQTAEFGPSKRTVPRMSNRVKFDKGGLDIQKEDD